MRHNVAGRKLGRTTAHRLAMFRNQLASLMTHERIVTTLPKAKELRPLAEKLVTQGKRGTVHARRLVGRWIPSREVIKRVFDEIAPRFESRAGGYLRIVKLGPRQGDGAEMAVLEFVDFDFKKSEAPAPAAEQKKPARSAGRKATEPAAEAAEPAKSQKKAAGKPAPAKGAVKAKPTRPAPPQKKARAPKKVGGS